MCLRSGQSSGEPSQFPRLCKIRASLSPSFPQPFSSESHLRNSVFSFITRAIILLKTETNEKALFRPYDAAPNSTNIHISRPSSLTSQKTDDGNPSNHLSPIPKQHDLPRANTPRFQNFKYEYTLSSPSKALLVGTAQHLNSHKIHTTTSCIREICPLAK